MGLKQSKDELLYQQVNCGNIEGIRALRMGGAGLEWADREGKTPLIVACKSLELYNVAKTLIELGANVNASSRVRFGGTPLHYAAERGLEPTVKLLLSHGGIISLLQLAIGARKFDPRNVMQYLAYHSLSQFVSVEISANALAMNGSYRTPLDIARSKGYSNIMRAIEGHVSLFSGWLRELHGPGFLHHLVPQLLSRRVWVVVLPCSSRNSQKPFRLELAIYTDVQDAQPRIIIPLWKANLVEPNFNQPDPVATISNISRIPRRWRKRRAIKTSQVARSTRITLVPVHESEKQQLQWFCNACKGIPQVRHPSFPSNNWAPTAPAAAPSTFEDEQLAMAINASLKSVSHERPLSNNNGTHPSQTMSGNRAKEADLAQPPIKTETHTTPVAKATPGNLSPAPVALSPSYPVVAIPNSAQEMIQESASSSSCTICLDAPVEGACVPCGHMVGCMSCLNEIKAKKFGCPVCRAQIDQVMRIYAA